MRWLLLAIVVLQTATCGQTGPLILPEPEPADDARGGALVSEEH